MNRRDFLLRVIGTGVLALARPQKAIALSDWDRVTLYDTYAMATYFDGGLGPRTGTVLVDWVVRQQPVTLEFWHGHGGENHRFTILPEHFAQMKKLKKVWIETTEVADHKHKLFVDMSDKRWRVPGAPPVEVPDAPEDEDDA